MKRIIKAFFTTGTGSAINLLLGIVSTKIISVVLGPNGIGLFSLLRQIQQTSLTVATIGGQTALVQGASSFKGREHKEYVRTVFLIFTFGSVLIGCLLFLFAPVMSGFVFKSYSTNRMDAIRWLAVPLVLNVLGAFLTSLLISYRLLGFHALTQILSGAALAILAYPAAVFVKNGYEIAFVALLSFQTLIFVVANILFLLKEQKLKDLMERSISLINLQAARHFVRIAGTYFITGGVAMISLLLLRAIIIRNQGLYMSGIFDAAWTISTGYINIAFSALGTYYFTTLCMKEQIVERAQFIYQVFRFTIFLLTFIILAMILFKPLVISIIYSPKFSLSLNILRWTLIGDFLRIGVWTLGTPITAFGDMRTYLRVELSWNIGLVLISQISLLQFGELQIIGAVYLLLNLLLLFHNIYYCYRRNYLIIDLALLFTWIGGFLLILGASLSTWSDTSVNWRNAVFWFVTSLGLFWLLLKSNEKQYLIHWNRLIISRFIKTLG